MKRDPEFNDKIAYTSDFTEHTHDAADITGLADVATSGDYNDLTNTPNIPTVPKFGGTSGDAEDGLQVVDNQLTLALNADGCLKFDEGKLTVDQAKLPQSDWDVDDPTSPAYILNKPSISSDGSSSISEEDVQLFKVNEYDDWAVKLILTEDNKRDLLDEYDASAVGDYAISIVRDGQNIQLRIGNINSGNLTIVDQVQCRQAKFSPTSPLKTILGENTVLAEQAMSQPITGYRLGPDSDDNPNKAKILAGQESVLIELNKKANASDIASGSSVVLHFTDWELSSKDISVADYYVKENTGRWELWYSGDDEATGPATGDENSTELYWTFDATQTESGESGNPDGIATIRAVRGYFLGNPSDPSNVNAGKRLASMESANPSIPTNTSELTNDGDDGTSCYTRQDSIAEEFSNYESYDGGDVVMHGGRRYVAKWRIQSGAAWNPDDWREESVQTAINSLAAGGSDQPSGDTTPSTIGGCMTVVIATSGAEASPKTVTLNTWANVSNVGTVIPALVSSKEISSDPDVTSLSVFAIVEGSLWKLAKYDGGVLVESDSFNFPNPNDDITPYRDAGTTWTVQSSSITPLASTFHCQLERHYSNNPQFTEWEIYPQDEDSPYFIPPWDDSERDYRWELHQYGDESDTFLAQGSGDKYTTSQTFTWTSTEVDDYGDEQSVPHTVTATRIRTDVEYSFLDGVNDGVTLVNGFSVDNMCKTLDEIDIDGINADEARAAIVKLKSAVKTIIEALKQL